MTRPTLCLTGLLLFMIACSPVRLYHKAGVPVAQMERAELACRIDAVESAPVANQIRQGPARYVPARRYCNSAGACQIRGGYFVEGEIYSVDVNAGLRREIERQCMADQGFTYIELPQCSSGVSSAVPAAATEVLPPVSAQSCVIRNADGTYQIVDVSE
ncbi:MAG: hypothetical protein AB8B58_14415 [Roseobacter sp.]